MHHRLPAVVLLLALALAGCASHETPRNVEAPEDGEAYQARYRSPLTEGISGFIDSERCIDTPPAATIVSHPGLPGARGAEVLSVGDLLQVFVEQDETFSGDYVIGMDGRLRLPFARPVAAAGQSPAEVEAAIASALVAAEIYGYRPQVSVLLADYAEADVFVSGAVFEPRQVVIGGANAQTRDLVRQTSRGAATTSRTLSAALRNAGGVRPDADLARVTLIRGGTRQEFDLSGAVAGLPHADPVLIAGDTVAVPSRNCFQEALMVPSAISPPGVTVFLSNTAETVLANAQGAIPDAREMRYGTRFLQAVFGLNCVGGSKLTNANRRAVLFSRNPITGESIVIDRSIEDILRRADRDEFNPYILPEDAMACYDSTVISLKNLAAALGIVGAAIYVAD
ncbi:polysaccharide biosynthesis/export family protein [Roseobacter sp. HKCCA0434]|uniref:polysaccharide biosynthesis/export family protein n=1 Tax=Roseobacter sp. HKCCA0434 TaxID=3079297 RepID=UPI002905821C|nr:polysaccharide biosynthesis/export family protein [Roseobacter sp. HKCCA0434]